MAMILNTQKAQAPPSTASCVNIALTADSMSMLAEPTDYSLLLRDRIAAAEYEEDCDFLFAAFANDGQLQQLNTEAETEEQRLMNEHKNWLLFIPCCWPFICQSSNSRGEELLRATAIRQRVIDRRQVVLRAVVSSLNTKYANRDVVLKLVENTSALKCNDPRRVRRERKRGRGLTGGKLMKETTMQWIAIEIGEVMAQRKDGLAELVYNAGQAAAARLQQRPQRAQVQAGGMVQVQPVSLPQHPGFAPA